MSEGSEALIIKGNRENDNNPLLAYLSPNHPDLKRFQIPVRVGETKTSMFGTFNGRLSLLMQLNNDLLPNEVLLHQSNMDFLGLREGDEVSVTSLPPSFHDDHPVAKAHVTSYSAKYLNSRCAKDLSFTDDRSRPLGQTIASNLRNHVWAKGQKLLFPYGTYTIVSHVDMLRGVSGEEMERGVITKDTQIEVTKYKLSVPFPPDVNPDELDLELKKLGIGGMKKTYEDILNSVIKVKCLPREIQKRLDLTPVRGVLFHGPPGSGKSLIARNFCKLILCVKPLLVNGPRLLNEYTKTVEHDVCKLFDPATKDYKLLGTKSPLNVIIFDDLDTLWSKRGKSEVDGAAKRVVSLLSTKIDGLEPLPNLLILATTNRLDLIDKAMLRPGRFEIKVKIDYPGVNERKEILELKLQAFAYFGLLAEDVDVDEIVNSTERFLDLNWTLLLAEH